MRCSNLPVPQGLVHLLVNGALCRSRCFTTSPMPTEVVASIPHLLLMANVLRQSCRKLCCSTRSIIVPIGQVDGPCSFPKTTAYSHYCIGCAFTVRWTATALIRLVSDALGLKQNSELLISKHLCLLRLWTCANHEAMCLGAPAHELHFPVKIVTRSSGRKLRTSSPG